MKIYIAECHTSDYAGEEVALLGVFTSKKLAEESFSRTETRQNEKVKHTCFRGYHEIKEIELDQWLPTEKLFWWHNKKWMGERNEKC